MKFVLIAVIALLVLGGGGAGAYFYFAKPAEASAGAEPGKEAAKHDEAKKDGEAAKDVLYVQLDPLILPIVDNNGVSQVVSMVVAIEVDGAANKETVKNLVPRLQDAFIQDMYGELSRQNMIKAGVIQVGLIKQRLNEISKKVLGGDIARDVLLQVVQQRPA